MAERFGARLRAARGDRTLRDVHVESGVSIAYISDLERGKLSNPSLATLSRIASALGVTLDQLLGTEAQGAPALPLDTPRLLKAFLDGPAFRAALDELSARWKVDAGLLRGEWGSLLAGIAVAGRAPATEADWMFVFEAIRRAVDR